MESIKLRSTIGKDGILRLQVPTTMQEQEIEIVVVIQPIQKTLDMQNKTFRKGWPKNFFKDVVGGWVGDFVRPPQGDFEIRGMS
ncbi:MAG: hypothetical protein HQK77_20155 [Desulfobacterales bacterium]|nr:hypothetical protein [Desulfobacterales bacterium]